MDKVRSRIQLFALMIIFFIYKAISGALAENQDEFILWTMITIMYAISLVILYFVLKRMQGEQINSKNL